MIKENQKIFNSLLASVDAALCLLSMLLAYLLRFYVFTGDPRRIGLLYYMQMMILIVPAYFLLFHQSGLYDAFRHKSLLAEIEKIIRSNLLGVAFIFLAAFLLKEMNMSRALIIAFGVINVLLTSLERVAVRLILRRVRKKGYNLKYLLLVGWNDAAAEFCQKISKNLNLGYKFQGYLNRMNVCPEQYRVPYIGDLSNLTDVLKTRSVDEVIISLDYEDYPKMERIIEICEKEGVKASILPFYIKYFPTNPTVDEIEGMPLINLRKIPLDNALNALMKRCFDIVVSAVGLVVLSPFLLAVAVAVKLTSPGPVIYRQQRIGLNRKKFTMYKFRSMRQDNVTDMTQWCGRRDDRRTAFGAFLRKFSLDELPQLYNVLKGDMSLVGPRPERPLFVEKFREEIPMYMLKHLVRPGITGWAQVNGWRGDTSITERIKCDIYYIENWSFLLDLKILLLTLLKGMLNRSEEL